MITRVLTYRLLNPVRSFFIFYILYILTIILFNNYEMISYCMVNEEESSKSEQEIIGDFIHLINKEKRLDTDTRLTETNIKVESLAAAVNTLNQKMDDLTKSMAHIHSKMSEFDSRLIQCEESMKGLQSRVSRVDRVLTGFKASLFVNEDFRNPYSTFRPTFGEFNRPFGSFGGSKSFGAPGSFGVPGSYSASSATEGFSRSAGFGQGPLTSGESTLPATTSLETRPSWSTRPSTIMPSFGATAKESGFCFSYSNISTIGSKATTTEVLTFGKTGKASFSMSSGPTTRSEQPEGFAFPSSSMRFPGFNFAGEFGKESK